MNDADNRIKFFLFDLLSKSHPHKLNFVAWWPATLSRAFLDIKQPIIGSRLLSVAFFPLGAVGMP